MENFMLLNGEAEEYNESLSDYIALLDSLKLLFHSYFSNVQKDLEMQFANQLLQDMNESLHGKCFDREYVFSFDIRTDEELRYVSFAIGPDYIELFSGGSSYDPQIGSDSYSNCKYSLGKSEQDELIHLVNETAGLIQSGAKLTIELPEDYINDAIE